jgi:hypothetical protein
MQKPFKYPLLIFVLVALYCLPPHAVAIERAFVVKQEHYFLGPWLVYVNRDKVKATNLNQGYTIVTMAPQWKVVFYRDDSKKAYESSMATFLRCGLLLTAGYTTTADIKEATKDHVSFKGITATRFVFSRAGNKLATRPAFSLADKTREAPVIESKYWISPLISDNSTVCHFLQKLFMTPPSDGYPLAFSDTRSDGTTNLVLDVLSCKLKNPAEVPIVYPSRFVRCKSQRDITLSASRQDSLNEFADTLGQP